MIRLYVRKINDMRINYRNDSGRSMIEMLGVLAIIGVLSVGGIAGYSKAMRKYRENKAIDQISQILTSVRTFYTNQGSFKGLDNASALKYEIVSQDMVEDDDVGEGTETGKVTLRNSFGGEVDLSTNDANNRFILKYGGIDKLSCITIASSDWGQTASSGLVEIKLGSGGKENSMNFTSSFNWKNKTLPITLQDAQKACASDENAISFEYDWLSY